MKIFTVLVASLCLGFTYAQHAEFGDLDMKDGMNEDEFEEYFGLPPVDDPAEKERREEALKEAEKEVHEINEEYQNGEVSWRDEINEYSDLPEDEFESEHTGAKDGEYARGLLEPTEEEIYDEESERYFDTFRFNRVSAPASYDAVKRGLVSPVKNQRSCGSCVAFASMAALETCFKKVTGVFGDYSEQQFVDCGYGQFGASGCDGAAPHAYHKWVVETKMKSPSHESKYPYKNTETDYTCKKTKPYKQGAKITGNFYTYQGDEELLKKMVYEHGAVVATVKAAGPFSRYKEGVFAGCAPGSSTDHAITVVGYGTENGVDYWLIKNSWGSYWGDKGFIKMKRGVGMCGIGRAISVVKCGKQRGGTSKPLTTKKPCNDKYSNCAQMAESHCWAENIKTNCPKSCGLCPGMTPVPSNTCYDQYSNCGDYTAYCSYDQIKNACKKACGLC